MLTDADYSVRQFVRLAIPTGILLVVLFFLWVPGGIGIGRSGLPARYSMSYTVGFFEYYRVRESGLRAFPPIRTAELHFDALGLTFAITVVLLSFYVSLIRDIRRDYPRPTPTHTCARCGYDLRASPGACPECGALRHEVTTGPV